MCPMSVFLVVAGPGIFLQLLLLLVDQAMRLLQSTQAFILGRRHAQLPVCVLLAEACSKQGNVRSWRDTCAAMRQRIIRLVVDDHLLSALSTERHTQGQ